MHREDERTGWQNGANAYLMAVPWGDQQRFGFHTSQTVVSSVAVEEAMTTKGTPSTSHAKSDLKVSVRRADK